MAPQSPLCQHLLVLLFISVCSRFVLSTVYILAKWFHKNEPTALSAPERAGTQTHPHGARWHQCDMLWKSDTKRQRTPRARYEPRARRNLAENLAGTSPETRVIFRRRHVYPPVHLTLAVLVQEMRMRRRPACLPSQRQLPAATGSAG